jgi:hypothetical protein
LPSGGKSSFDALAEGCAVPAAQPTAKMVSKANLRT